MTVGELSQLITAIATFIAAAGALIVSIHNTRKIREVHIATNSMKDELVAATAKSSKAEGVKEEKERIK